MGIHTGGHDGISKQNDHIFGVTVQLKSQLLDLCEDDEIEVFCPHELGDCVSGQHHPILGIWRCLRALMFCSLLHWFWGLPLSPSPLTEEPSSALQVRADCMAIVLVSRRSFQGLEGVDCRMYDEELQRS
jgi:hypothetical protein